MDQSDLLVVGKVKWFDGAGQCGAVANISAASYVFERRGADLGFPPVARGDLVTFTDAGPGPLGRVATNVQPAASRVLSEIPPTTTQ
jgi:hypothetical protein